MDWFWLILFATCGLGLVARPVLVEQNGWPSMGWRDDPRIAAAGFVLLLMTLVSAFFQIAWWAPLAVVAGGVLGGGVLLMLLGRGVHVINISGTAVGLVALPFLVGIFF